MAQFCEPLEGECQICAALAVRLCSAEDRATRAISQLSGTSDSEAVRVATLDFVHGRAEADEIPRQWREHRLLHASGDESGDPEKT
jgi:hypothetical protein